MMKGQLLDDAARVAVGVMSTLSGAKNELDSLVRYRIERLLTKLDLVSRDEFNVARDIASRAIEEQGELERRISEIEKRLNSATTPVKERGQSKGKSTTPKKLKKEPPSVWESSSRKPVAAKKNLRKRFSGKI